MAPCRAGLPSLRASRAVGVLIEKGEIKSELRWILPEEHWSAFFRHPLIRPDMRPCPSGAIDRSNKRTSEQATEPLTATTDRPEQRERQRVCVWT